MIESSVESAVRDVLRSHGKLSQDPQDIGAAEDLYHLGLTSHASVNVMLGLEDEFDIEFPDEKLTKATFATIVNLTDVVTVLTQDVA